MLDRPQNQFSGLDLEQLKAVEPPLGAPFEDHVAWGIAVARIVGTKRRVPVLAIGDSYQNFGSADCDEVGL